MFKHIMVPVDLAHADKLSRALETAALMAGATDATVSYAHAFSTAAHRPTAMPPRLAYGNGAAAGHRMGNKPGTRRGTDHHDRPANPRTVSIVTEVQRRGGAMPLRRNEGLERVAGIEPARLAWKARALPLHHTRAG